MRLNGATRSTGGVSETSGSTIGRLRVYSLTTVQFRHPSKTDLFVLRCRPAPTPILFYNQPLLHAEPKSSRQTTDSFYGYGRLAMNQAVLTVVLYLFLPVQFRQWSQNGLAPRALRYDNWGVRDARRWWYHDGSYCRRTRRRRLIQGTKKCGSGQTRGSPRSSCYRTFHTRRGRISVFRSRMQAVRHRPWQPWSS